MSLVRPSVQRASTPALDLRPIASTIGILLSILGASMLLPAMADLRAGSGGQGAFVGAAAITIFVGVLLIVSGRGTTPARLDLRQAFLLTASVWVVLALFATLPLMWGPSHLSFVHALFEAVSGLTTTGSTVMTGLDAMSPGILLWRAMLHWFGGVGIVVIAIAVLPALSIGGMQLFRTESSDRSEKFMPRAGSVAKGLLTAYLLLSLLCTICYLLAGMTPFDAVTLAMSTVSSGGFANSDSSFGIFTSPAVEYVAVVFMLAASLPFPLYVRALGGDVSKLFRNAEVRLFLAVVAAFTLASFLQQSFQGVAHGETALRQALFTVASLVSSTGFMAVDYTHWGPLSDAIFFVLMFLGGCTGSTAGGLKTLRLLIAMKAVRQHLKRISYRNGVFPIRYGGASVSDEVVASVLGFIFLYVATFAVAGVILSLMGLDLRTAFSASIASLSNVGPGLGPIVGPATTYANLPDPAVALLTFVMLLGRLEILTVLVLTLPRFWMR
ncbi:Trk system potassium uptake protein [Azorhizobium oxalatiphilum]|uniref:Trk system potassium uptake protein n=1 Tax=Azorhizobium oxalatiphilum TaxID=980631 RepID=A0A917FG90_9HYPH|nr:TrkH family potassium uptake protein [Azorhizobium oxalatiphilum]GGF79329.1 Trk system potassium uptake protein [Azorhizobium oxalatiphilum]